MRYRKITKLEIGKSQYGYFIRAYFETENEKATDEIIASAINTFREARDRAFTIRYTQSKILIDDWGTYIPIIDEDGNQYC